MGCKKQGEPDPNSFFNVKKDAVIEFEGSSTLENFKSKALNRTFPSITFVNSVAVVKGK